MINVIMEAVSNSMQSEFGNEYEITMEEQRQDINKPCFFISCINSTKKEFPGKRDFRQNQFCIRYVPVTEHSCLECNETAERLMDCLTFVTVWEDLIRGTAMNYEMKDGVFQFYVNYDCYVYKEQEMTSMETVEISQKAEG